MADGSWGDIGGSIASGIARGLVGQQENQDRYNRMALSALQFIMSRPPEEEDMWKSTISKISGIDFGAGKLARAPQSILNQDADTVFTPEQLGSLAGKHMRVGDALAMNPSLHDVFDVQGAQQRKLQRDLVIRQAALQQIQEHMELNPGEPIPGELAKSALAAGVPVHLIPKPIVATHAQREEEGGLTNRLAPRPGETVPSASEVVGAVPPLARVPHYIVAPDGTVRTIMGPAGSTVQFQPHTNQAVIMDAKGNVVRILPPGYTPSHLPNPPNIINVGTPQPATGAQPEPGQRYVVEQQRDSRGRITVTVRDTQTGARYTSEQAQRMADQGNQEMRRSLKMDMTELVGGKQLTYAQMADRLAAIQSEMTQILSAKGPSERKMLQSGAPYMKLVQEQKELQQAVERMNTRTRAQQPGGMPIVGSPAGAPSAQPSWTPPPGAVSGTVDGKRAYKLPDGSVVDENGQPIK